MIEIEKIVDRDSLKQWLTDWPASQGLDEVATRQIAVTIGHRAAMRVMPVWWEWSLSKDARKRDLTALPILRSLLTSGVAAKTPTPEVMASAAAASAASASAAASAASASDSASDSAAAASASASDSAAAASAAFAAAASAAFASAASAAAASDSDSAAAWTSIRADCAVLSEGADVFVTPLWVSNQNPIETLWSETKAQATGPEWTFWTKWYDDALAGHAANWDMLEEIALIKSNVWDSGAVAVAGRIAKIMTTSERMPEVKLSNAVAAANVAAETAKSAATDAEVFASSAAEASSKAKKQFDVLQKEYKDLQKTSEALQDINHKQQSEAAQAANALEKFRANLEELQQNASVRIKALEDAFSDSQALKEPVKLWQEKGEMHQARATSAHRIYYVGLVVSGLYVMMVFWLVVKTDIRYDLLPMGCDFRLRPELCNGFGVAAFVTVSAVLSIFTLFLWFVRLKMKEFLSERHLALDAEEKRTFAQVYVGLLAMGDASEEAKSQRGLVYAALFRPTSDGIVKEDGGLDPSVAAIVTKALTK